MCSHHQQGRKLLRSDLHLPQDSVYLSQRAESSGHRSALRPHMKGSGAQRWGRWAVRAAQGLQEHAEFCSHSFPQPQGMQRILSPVKHHPASLSSTGSQGCYRKEPPLLFIEACMTDGPEKARGWGDAVFSLTGPGTSRTNRWSVVKQKQLDSRPPGGLGQLSPCPGFNTATAGLCRKMSTYKSRLLEQISHRWRPRCFSVRAGTHLSKLFLSHFGLYLKKVPTLRSVPFV